MPTCPITTGSADTLYPGNPASSSIQGGGCQYWPSPTKEDPGDPPVIAGKSGTGVSGRLPICSANVDATEVAAMACTTTALPSDPLRAASGVAPGSSADGLEGIELGIGKFAENMAMSFLDFAHAKLCIA